MVAARANWKGFIKFGEVAVAVALYTAASSSERIAFNTLNRATGNRVRREFVDSETGAPVERDKQVKGYEVENGEYVVLEPEEVASAVPGSDKTLKIEAFVPCNEIDDVYFDKPYYLMGSYSVICWYGPFPIAPLIQLGGSSLSPQASRARRQPR